MRFLPQVFLFSTAFALTGCAVTATTSPVVTVTQSAVALTGSVRSGSLPIASAHVHLLAASTSGYGTASTSLLTATTTGQSDSIGAFVLTDAAGNFIIPAGVTCNSASQVYLYATAGSTGTGANPAIGLMAAFGTCPSTATTAANAPAVTLNEVTTVAAAYTLAGFATDATHIASSGSTAAQLGLANAFALNANLVNFSTGTALQATPNGNGTPPAKTLNTLANLLHACTVATSAGPCNSLFAAALSAGATGTAPSETATAAINLAHFPGAGGTARTALYSLATSIPAFAPALNAIPNDFTLAIVYTGGGISAAYSVAIDSAGNPWFTNLTNSSITRLSPLGVPASPASGYLNGSPAGPVGISIDLSGNTWVAEAVTNSVTKFASSGALLSPSPGYTGGGISAPQALASDSLGNIWVTSYNNALSEFSNAGVVISPGSGFNGGGLDTPIALAIDNQGSVWTANASQTYLNASKFSNTGRPLSPPLGFTGGGLGRSGAVAIDSQGATPGSPTTMAPTPTPSPSSPTTAPPSPRQTASPAAASASPSPSPSMASATSGPPTAATTPSPRSITPATPSPRPLATPPAASASPTPSPSMAPATSGSPTPSASPSRKWSAPPPPSSLRSPSPSATAP